MVLCRSWTVAMAVTFAVGGHTLEVNDAAPHYAAAIPSSQVVVVVAYPKITNAPIMKRKLGSNKWDAIHEGLQAQKRDGKSCPLEYQLCPESMKGGCCPKDRVCAEDSCLPGNPAVSSACGKTNYFACSIEDGGGCCPSDYVCGRTGCTPSVGVIHSETCGVNSYLCPASMNFGCCKSGMGCGLGSCYSTAIESFTLTQIITTTDAKSNARTLTSTIISATTPIAPTAVISSNPNAVPKINAPATAIPKTQPTSSGTASSGSNGLTGVQISGIIAGAVALLGVVLIAAFIIMRRLNRAIKISDAKTRTNSSGPGGYSRPRKPVDVDAMSVDPLMISTSESTETIKLPSHVSIIPTETHEVDSSPIFRSPFSPSSPPFMNYGKGYNTVARSESLYSASAAGHRNGSVESTPPAGQVTAGGYFDIPQRSDYNSPTSYMSPSSQTYRPPQHGRNWSDVSDQSAVSQTSSGMAELEAGADGDRKGSVKRALEGIGLGSIVRRKRGEGGHLLRGTQHQAPLVGRPARSDWTPMVGTGGVRKGTLSHIEEAGESRVELDGELRKPAGLSNAQLRHLSLSGQEPNTAYVRDDGYS